MKLSIRLILAFALSLTALGVAVAQDDMEEATIEGTVRMARANWDTGFFQAEVFDSLLTELGYEVERTGTIAADLFYQAVAEGEDVDMWANGWLPLHVNFLTAEGVIGEAIPVGFQVEAGALQGYLVDKATADEFGITNIMDMTDPEIAAIFDNDDDGRAELTGCNPGWGCEGVIEDTLDTLELRDSIDHVQGEYSLLMQDTIGRYERGEPIFFYTWTPNWTVGELALGEDVVWIEAPGDELGVDATPNVPGCVDDPCSMGFQGNDIRAVGNTEFLMENPAVAALMSQITIPLADIAAQNQLMRDGADSPDDIEAQAAAWIESNRDTVDEWLTFARENADNTELVEEALNSFMDQYVETAEMEEDMSEGDEG
mgnify:CR=1 FL=1